MSATTNKSEAELIREVTESLHLLRARNEERTRWFWLGWAVEIYRSLTILGLAVGLIGIAFQYLGPSGGGDPGMTIVGVLTALIGCGMSIVVSTWAIRYCQARADGRLSR